GRNLVVCIDGTSNQFGEKNTNVIELYHLLEKDNTQVTFYNSGIGTYARPSFRSWTFYKQVLGHKVDLAIAWNFEKTVLSAYQWLSERYHTGDRIFLFGKELEQPFDSRGAYQVRCLSAMIETVGLIHEGNAAQIPFAFELYADTGKSDNAREMAKRFKDTFGRAISVHFVGAWDTVSSIGIFRDKTLPGTTSGMKHVCFFRHALALDERRVKFLPEYAYEGSAAPDQHRQTDAESSVDGNMHHDLVPQTKEVWFAGTHSDIQPPLRWMSYEASAAGLRLLPVSTAWEIKANLAVHESLTTVWWLFEALPWKRLTYRNEHGQTNRPHLGAGRHIRLGQKIHSSVL
ncbi:uncharacterized protein STEHIDRAFT_36800, partial [Stereum hirsutum FP-91666 SS1]